VQVQVPVHGFAKTIRFFDVSSFGKRIGLLEMLSTNCYHYFPKWKSGLKRVFWDRI
jgi:hypothetical protein